MRVDGSEPDEPAQGFGGAIRGRHPQLDAGIVRVDGPMLASGGGKGEAEPVFLVTWDIRARGEQDGRPMIRNTRIGPDLTVGIAPITSQLHALLGHAGVTGVQITVEMPDSKHGNR